MNLFIGGDLVDLISLEDKKYQIKYALPSEIDNELKARLVIQTANKVRQVVYGSIEGSLNSLLALSNSKVAKLWINMDAAMNSSKGSPASVKISDAKSSNSSTCLSILVYTGGKESTQLNDVKEYLSPRALAEQDSDDAEDLTQTKKKEVPKEQLIDIRYLMPGHMPQYLRIDTDIKEGLLRLQDLMSDYSNFDVLALERDVTRTLELELDK